MAIPQRLQTRTSQVHLRMRASIGLALAIVFAFAVAAVPAAQSQTITVLHYFLGGQDGGIPQTGVTLDRAGNVYGTTPVGGYQGGVCGGQGGCGMVYRSTFKNGAWIYTPLYFFQGGNDGMAPQVSVTVGPQGALYGTTLFGGGTGCGQGFGCGTIFKLTPPPTFCHSVLCTWTETVLYRFTGALGDPTSPFGGVIFDAAGNLYGMAGGVVYKLSPSGGSWVLSTLYTFQGTTDGDFPFGNLAMDAAGNLYGTAAFGGAHGDGTVFRLVRSAGGYSFELLYTFTGGSDGGNPEAGVVLDSAGNIFGDTSYFTGGVFELSPAGGSWNFSAIDPIEGGLNAPVNLDSAGNIYSTNYSDGAHHEGSVFKLTHSQSGWTHTIIHSFDGADDGALPLSNVVFDASGNMYGTTTSGGRGRGDGTVWQLTP